jgi:cytochrome c556
MTTKSKAFVFLSCTGLALVAASAMGQDSAPGKGPGWTGLTHPKDVIAARQSIMIETERIMRPIDEFEAGEAADEDALRSTAETIEQFLVALPHLFPPTTNLYDPNVETPETIALPAIWQNFDTFYQLAGNAESAAHAMTQANGTEALRTAARNLRAACDACHAPFLRAYKPAEVSEEDLNFDFDSVLKGK